MISGNVLAASVPTFRDRPAPRVSPPFCAVRVLVAFGCEMTDVSVMSTERLIEARDQLLAVFIETKQEDRHTADFNIIRKRIRAIENELAIRRDALEGRR